MRVILSGGGTGGHIYPALAIGKQLLEEDPKTKLLYIGTQRGMESRIVPEEGMDFEAIDITGFKRSLSLQNVQTVMRFLRGVKRCKMLIKQFRPDVVIGTGGYVCGPVVYAAAKLGIPTLIHEQNSVSGLTNTFLARYASAVAVSFPESLEAFEHRVKKGSRVVYTGNPSGTRFLSGDREKGFETLGVPVGARVVLMFGGSGGAQALNRTMVEMMPHLAELPDDVHFVFVTGESRYDEQLREMHAVMPNFSAQLHVLPYIHNMPDVMKATTLIVSRAGASSLAEMSVLGVPAILIPSPNVTNNHQEKNALSVANAGSAELILEPNLTGELLFTRIQKLIANPILLDSMHLAALKLGMADSAERIVREVKKII